jgi:hypothetical protein
MAERERIMATLTSQRASGKFKGPLQLSRPDELILGVTDPDFVSSSALLQHELDQRKHVLELRHELALRDEESGWDLWGVEAAEHALESFRMQEIDSYLSSGATRVFSCDESGYQLQTRERRIQAEAELVTARKQHEKLLSSVPQLVRDCVARRLRRLKDSDVGRAVDNAESRVKAAEEAIMMYDVTFGSQHPISTSSWENETTKAAWLPYLTAYCPHAVHDDPDGGPTIDGDIVAKHVSVLRGTGIRQLRSDLVLRQALLRNEAEKAARVVTLWAGYGQLDLAALRELLREDVAVKGYDRYYPPS